MRSLQEETVVLTGVRLLGEETTVPQENTSRSPPAFLEEKPWRKDVRAVFRALKRTLTGSNTGHYRLDHRFDSDPLCPGKSLQELAESQPSPIPAPCHLEKTGDVNLSGPTRVPFDSLYELNGKKLQKGVFLATRKSDGENVVIKVVSRMPERKYIRCPGLWKTVDRDVGLNVMVSGEQRSQHVLQMHRWFEEPKKIILIYESIHGMSLRQLLKSNGGRLDEKMARFFFKQAADGVMHCLERGVFHETIKEEKLIIDTENQTLKLWLLGNEKVLSSDFPHSLLKGQDSRCYAEEETVWSLGKLLYKMIHGRKPYVNKWGKNTRELTFDPSLSRACCDFLTMCLKKNALHRATLQEMMSDDWFNGVEEVSFDSLSEGVLMATRKSDGEKISQMQDSRLSERSFDVMDPSTVTLDSKLLRDLSTYLILSASTVEDFRPEVFRKVLCILYTHGMPNRSLDERTLEGTHEDAKRITRELLLGIQRRIANGSLILTEENEVLSDRDMQSVISDLLRLLEDQSIHPEPHDDHECLHQKKTENKGKTGKRFFRRLQRRRRRRE